MIDDLADGRKAKFDGQMMELIDAARAAERNGDYALADRTASAVLDLAWEQVLEAAELNEVPEDLLLHAEAVECEQRGDWNGARKAYDRVIQLAKESASPFAVWKAHADLADLLMLLGDRDEALQEQRLGTAAAREDESVVGLRMALIAEAARRLRLDDSHRAARCVKEALAIADPDSTDKLGAATLSVLQAWCEALNGKIGEAQALLHDCFPYFQRASEMPCAAGIHSALGYWWRVKSICCQMRDDFAGETHARQMALATARQVDEMPHVTSVYTKARIANDLDDLADALWRNDNFAEASLMRRDAAEIRTALKLPIVSRQ